MMTPKKDYDEQFWREAPVLKLEDGLYWEYTKVKKRKAINGSGML